MSSRRNVNDMSTLVAGQPTLDLMDLSLDMCSTNIRRGREEEVLR